MLTKNDKARMGEIWELGVNGEVRELVARAIGGDKYAIAYLSVSGVRPTTFSEGGFAPHSVQFGPDGQFWIPKWREFAEAVEHGVNEFPVWDELNDDGVVHRAEVMFSADGTRRVTVQEGEYAQNMASSIPRWVDLVCYWVKRGLVATCC